MPLQAIPAVSIRKSVADAVRSALREGQLVPGQDLSEVTLASKFEVSRGPVREALLVLVEEGLLVHVPNRGWSVVNFTAEDHAHINDIRIVLEAHALEQARRRVTAQDLERIQEAKVELLRMFKDSEQPSRDAMEIVFHGLIWELSGNPWLASSLHRVLVPYFTFSRRLGFNSSNLDPRLADARHQLYLDYLAGKTTRTSQECVRIHLGLLSL